MFRLLNGFEFEIAGGLLSASRKSSAAQVLIKVSGLLTVLLSQEVCAASFRRVVLAISRRMATNSRHGAWALKSGISVADADAFILEV